MTRQKWCIVQHEMAHAYDRAKSKITHEFSEDIVKKALSNIKLQKRFKDFDKIAFRITGDIKEIKKDHEIFAYALECEMGKTFSNKLSKEIYKLLIGGDENGS